MKKLTRQQGHSMIVAFICSAVVVSVGVTTYDSLQKKYHVIHQSSSWKESLLTAEGGVEVAMNEIRKNLYDRDNAWAGWTKNADEIQSVSNQPGATGGNMTYSLISTAVLREGEGGRQSWAHVTVDAPRSLVDRTGEQWYRIRSLGVAEVPGNAVVSGERDDLRLRKLDLRVDRRTGRKLMTPQASRLIETIAKPVGAFRLAVFGVKTVNMTDHNIVVDSYDSRDNSKSTNGGYDVAKRQEHGDVGTNGTVINAGNAHIYGNAYTNGGTVFDSSNVTGDISSDFYQEVLPVSRPNTLPDISTPLSITGTATIDARAGAPSNYQFSTVSLSGQNTLRIRGSADGSATYCQIVVTGDISLSGQAQIILDRGVFVRCFVVGDADITGKGFLNPNSALALQLYGVDRPKNADGSPASPGRMKIAGNGGFCGAVYAPNYDIEMKGGGNTDSIFGAFVANTVTMTGVQSVHYDEALSEGGLIVDYKIVSWFEDER
jgi:hypothetical protein